MQDVCASAPQTEIRGSEFRVNWGQHYPKTNVVVPVVRDAPEAIGTPHVHLAEVRRAATQHMGHLISCL